MLYRVQEHYHRRAANGEYYMAHYTYSMPYHNKTIAIEKVFTYMGEDFNEEQQFAATTGYRIIDANHPQFQHGHYRGESNVRI